MHLPRDFENLTSTRKMKNMGLVVCIVVHMMQLDLLGYHLGAICSDFQWCLSVTQTTFGSNCSSEYKVKSSNRYVARDHQHLPWLKVKP